MTLCLKLADHYNDVPHTGPQRQLSDLLVDGDAENLDRVQVRHAIQRSRPLLL